MNTKEQRIIVKKTAVNIVLGNIVYMKLPSDINKLLDLAKFKNSSYLSYFNMVEQKGGGDALWDFIDFSLDMNYPLYDNKTDYKEGIKVFAMNVLKHVRKLRYTIIDKKRVPLFNYIDKIEEILLEYTTDDLHTFK